MTSKSPGHLMLACTINRGLGHAQNVLKWKRIGDKHVGDPDGYSVRVVSNTDLLPDLVPKRDRLYLGPAWTFAYSNGSSPRDLIEEFRRHGGTVIDLS